MIPTKEFEIWKVRAAALVAIPEAATLGEVILGAGGIRGAGGIQEAADIRAEGTQGAADIRAEGTQGADIPAGILEAIPAGAEVIPTQGAQVEDPTGDEELQRRALKTTQECSR
jgi:hypothetical protein